MFFADFRDLDKELYLELFHYCAGFVIFFIPLLYSMFWLIILVEFDIFYVSRVALIVFPLNLVSADVVER